MCFVMKWSAHTWTTLTLMLTLSSRKLFRLVHLLSIVVFLLCMLCGHIVIIMLNDIILRSEVTAY